MSSSRPSFHPSALSPASSSPQDRPTPVRDKFTSTFQDKTAARKPEREFAMDKGIESRVSPREMTLAEFQKKALPAIRIGKLRKIQALVRGWYARKYIVPLKRINHYASYRLVEKLIDEWVELHFIPQIVLEIIQQNQAYRDYSFYSPEGKILYEIADAYQNSLVHKMCEEVVRDLTRSLVNQHLWKKQEDAIAEKRHLPQVQISTAFITALTDQMLPDVVREGIGEIVDEYVVDVEWVKMLEFDYLPPEIEETINTAGWEVAIELVIEDAVEGLTMIYLVNIIEEAYELEKVRLDDEAVERAFQAVISRCILTSALTSVLALDEEIRREEEKAQGDIMEVSQVEDEELEEFNMDSPSKVAEEKSAVKSPPKQVEKSGLSAKTPAPYVESRSSPRLVSGREISPIAPNTGAASKKSNRDYVDRSQLGRMLAEKGWTYDPNAVSRSDINASRRVGEGGPPYSRESGTVTDYPHKARK